MSQPFLTIGMATFDDFYGCRETIQTIKYLHDEIKREVEIVVVDNNPGSRHSNDLVNFIERWSGDWTIRHVPFTAKQGTGPARQHLFDVAEGEVVLCTDCHVAFHNPGSLRKLIEWFRARPGSLDMVQGPLAYDDLKTISTHFDPKWRGEMFGIWSTAWCCSVCARTSNAPAAMFQADHLNKNCAWKRVDDGKALTRCPVCKTPLPKDLPYEGHERFLVEHGFIRGDDEILPPYEIPAQGLGMFACRKEAWPGFNPDFTGFGGEEVYIHEKIRRAGGTCYCMPDLPWNHRFYRPDGAPYPYNLEAKVRNYILGFTELGWSLDSVYEHFVVHGTLPKSSWNLLVEQPTRKLTSITRKSILDQVSKARQEMITDNLPQPPAELTTLREVFDWLCKQPRDLDQHLQGLFAFTKLCPDVVEITKRRESSLTFVAARPKTLISFQSENDLSLYTAHDMLAKIETNPKHGEQGTNWIMFVPDGVTDAHDVNRIKHRVEGNDGADLLFIDSKHNAATVFAQLQAIGNKIRKFIIIHDTGMNAYGLRGEDGSQGLLFGISKWMDEAAEPDWFVHTVSQDQHGLVVLSRVQSMKPVTKLYLLSPGYGAGTELKQFFDKFGIVESETCSCRYNAIRMDLNGPDWCDENIDTILDWLKGEAEARKFPFVRTAAAQIVRQAIRKARKDPRVIADFNLDPPRRGLLSRLLGLGRA